MWPFMVLLQFLEHLSALRTASQKLEMDRWSQDRGGNESGLSVNRSRVRRSPASSQTETGRWE